MSKLSNLISEAKEYMIFRNHIPYNATHFSKTKAEIICQICNSWVQINVKPLPNEIDIGGPAIVINCNKKRYRRQCEKCYNQNA